MAYFDRYGVEFTEDQRTLVRCPKDFNGRYVIPKSVREISGDAFAFCDKLLYVSKDGDRQSTLNFAMREGAFRGCSNLKAIQIPAAHKVEIGDYCFQDCVSLEMVSVPFELKSIGSHAFTGCANLREVYIDSLVRPNLYSLKAALPCGVLLNDSQVEWTEYEEQVIMWYVNWACDRNKDNYQNEDIFRMSSFVATQLKVGGSYYLNNGSWIDAPECEQHLRFMEDDKKEALFKLFVSAAAEDNLNAYWLIVFTSTAAFDDIKKLIDSGQSNLPQDVVSGYKTVISKRSKRGINVNHLFFAMTEEEKKQLYDIFK